MQQIPEWLTRALEKPTMSVPEAGQAVGDLGRNASYAAAQRGDIPTISTGSRLRVPCAWVRRQLMLDEAPAAEPHRNGSDQNAA